MQQVSSVHCRMRNVSRRIPGNIALREPRIVANAGNTQGCVCFVKFLWAVSAFLLVRLSGCF